MTEIKLLHGDCLDELKNISDNSVDLVIADPPYWKVVNQRWDYQWKTKQDYVDWSIMWMKSIARVMRYGGTIYLFGYFRILSLLIPYFEEMGLDLRQQIIVDKGLKSVAGRATKNYRMFPNTTESIIFATKENRNFIKPFLKNKQAERGLSAKEINEAIGVKSNGGGMWSIYTGKNICQQFPTEETWNRLQTVLDFNLPYSKVAQTFNPQMGITDVWNDIDFYTEKRFHPTQKPSRLIERLILASSNVGDLVLDPFMGSGITGILCKEMNRNFIGIERDAKYFNTIVDRLEINCLT